MFQSITNAHVIGMLVAIAIFFSGAISGIWWKELINLGIVKNGDFLSKSVEEKIKQKAVKLGYAFWEVDEFGETAFTWKENVNINIYQAGGITSLCGERENKL